jgi:hypothetical protein
MHQLSGDRPPYVLDSAAIGELKLALYALAAFEADPSVRPDDPATEQSWKRMDLSPQQIGAWDPDSAHEFALAVSRYKGYGVVVPGPWTRLLPGPQAGPQPTATGLELIAGAVNKLLGGVNRMTKYEAWRGGSMPPDLGAGSLASGPSSPDIAIVYTYDFGARIVDGMPVPNVPMAPPDVLAGQPILAKQIEEAEVFQRTAWNQAKDAKANCGLEAIGDPCQTGEQARDYWSWTMDLRRQQRDALVMKAVALSKTRWVGTTVPDKLAEMSCTSMGGTWAQRGAGGVCLAKDKRAPTKAGARTLGFVSAGASAAFVLLWAKHKGFI